MKPDLKQQFLASLQFLTILPCGKAQESSPQWNMMPLIGLMLGGCLLLLTWLAAPLHPMLLTLIVLLSWLIMTGFLHLDGLADLVDGLSAAHGNPTRLLAVMKDPHIGAFAVIALILLILSKFILLYILFEQQQFMALLLIPAWARFAAAYWGTSLPALSDGLAAWCQQAGDFSPWLWLILLLTLSWLIAPILCFFPIFIALWRYFLQHKLGGMNGDCLGAGIELSEVFMLFLCCLAL